MCSDTCIGKMQWEKVRKPWWLHHRWPLSSAEFYPPATTTTDGPRTGRERGETGERCIQSRKHSLFLPVRHSDQSDGGEGPTCCSSNPTAETEQGISNHPGKELN